MNQDKLKALIKSHEGCRTCWYLDTEGFWTIGIGHKRLPGEVIGEPWSQEKIDQIFHLDLQAVLQDLERYKWFKDLGEARQAALIDMAFNLGLTGLRKFKKMLAALVQQDWEQAAAEAINSKWSKQVGQRAQTIERMLRHGTW